MSLFTPLSPPAQERQLVDTVERLGKRRAKHIVLHIHFSQLSPAYQRPSYIRIATDTFTALASGLEGQIFNLENNDLIFIAEKVPQERLATFVARLQALFTDDPLTQDNNAMLSGAFCTWYDLSDDLDYENLLTSVQTLLHEAEVARQKQGGPLAHLRRKPEPVQPSTLAALEQSLGMADISTIARRQPVCTIFEDGRPQPIFEELYVSIEDLQKASTPGTDLLSDPWLFRYLTQTLDKRVMYMLIRDGISFARPFSINLNVGTVLSPAFMRFEAIVTPQLRGRLVIEMNKLDVFSDVGAFRFARDYLHDHGFRLCLDGLTHHTLPYYDREKLGFDLVKLYWTPNSLDTMPEALTPALRTTVRETGQANTILCRCDNERALALGQDLGIVMYQGHAVDNRLKNS